MSSLVSVICLCYNHEKYVREALESVVSQSYKNIQLIAVDDASTDNSTSEILAFKNDHPALEVIFFEQNNGHCKAFNQALELTRGEYIIDLAADDVLMPGRIEAGIKALQRAGEPYGVNFTDAAYINERGDFLHYHSKRYPHHTIPQGDIYVDLVYRYFICPPSLMFAKKVMADLGGYDEQLAYEDFDFLIRSSRNFHFCYTPEALVKRRIVKNAQNKKQFKLFSNQSISTYKVCLKILEMNSHANEQAALSKRILYEMRLNIRLLNFSLVKKYFLLWNSNQQMKF